MENYRRQHAHNPAPQPDTHAELPDGMVRLVESGPSAGRGSGSRGSANLASMLARARRAVQRKQRALTRTGA
jgi:hypothetical protein